jgi:hypothetical protein
MSYDPQTGRRITSLADQLRHAEYYLKDDKSQLEQAHYMAALTIRERFTTSGLFVLISGAITAAVTLAAVFGHSELGLPEETIQGYIAAAVMVGIVLFFSLMTVLSQIGDHRGGAAATVKHKEANLRTQQRKYDSLEAELVDEQRRATEKSAAKAHKKKTEPEPVELLEVIVATASRNSAATESDALLWAVVAENPDDEDAWEAIADRNGWSADLMAKIKNVRSSARGPRAASAAIGAPAIAGWAG